jgi:hypothetical protein
MNEKHHLTTLHLTVDEESIPFFLPLLTKGFRVKTKVGCSVRELICRHLGLSADYMDHRIQTIFLDGKAVDNVEDAVVDEGATLALSAAMPGLAGATLRRGGPYAAMRHQITHEGRSEEATTRDGTVILKLFNLVAKEIGSVFLTQGIQIDGKKMQRHFLNLPEHFWEKCHAVRIEGIDSTVKDLFDIKWEERLVFLKVVFATTV